ncbi:MAG: CheR family methyltransferase [Candidatus Binatia bacterium]
MSLSISDQQLSHFSDFIEEKMGLHFPPQRWSDLQRGAAAAAREFGFEDVPACVQWLMSVPLTKQQSEILAGNLTVGETYFFRERKSFDIIANRILPALIRARQGGERRLRIWSAACCTGEEPYSLAILLRHTMADLEDWNVTILGTDLNARFLRKAAAGSYGHWSFRDTPAWVKDRWFKQTADGHFEILPEIRRMVSFAHLNLVEDLYPSLTNDTNAMDLIFCRNVLMYFSQQQARRVIQKLYRAQTDDGWLVVSPSESSQVLFRPYATMNFPGAILYQKASREAQASKHHAQAAEIEPLVFDQPSAATVAEPPQPMMFEPQEQSPPASRVQDAQAAEPVVTPYGEAAALYEQGCYEDAADKLMELASGPSPQPEAFKLLARALANQGKLAEALSWCDRGIAADKLTPANYYLRAIVLQEQGETAQAAVSLRQALYLDPNFILAHFALGNLARHSGKLREADKHLKNALKILHGYRQDTVLPESEGISAGRLTEIITSLVNLETAT